MNERFEKLLELNKNMDEIIAVAKIETDKMQIEVEQYKTDAVNRLFKVLEDIKPMMDVICSSLKINQYDEKLIHHVETKNCRMYSTFNYGNPDCTNYGIKISRPNTLCSICVWDGKIYSELENLMSKHEFIFKTKEYIAENINEITNKIYETVEKLLQSTIENKAKKQRDLQEELQEKINKFKTE